MEALRHANDVARVPLLFGTNWHDSERKDRREAEKGAKEQKMGNGTSRFPCSVAALAHI